MLRLRHLTARYRRHRWRWVTLSGLLLFALLAGSYWYISSPQRLARLTQTLISTLTGAQVRVFDARFNFDGLIHLRGVELHLKPLNPTHDFESHPAFLRLASVDEILIQQNLWQMLIGRFEPQRITLIRPMIHVTESASTGVVNFSRLQQSSSRQKQRQLPHHLPEVYLREAQLYFSQVDDHGQLTAQATVQLSGRLTMDDVQHGLYHVDLREQLFADDLSLPDQPPSTAPIPASPDVSSTSDGPDTELATPLVHLTGKLDLIQSTIDAELHSFTLNSPLRFLMPRDLRRWWNQLQPTGSVPRIALHFDPTAADQVSAELELEKVALTLPYGEISSRMTNVSGRFKIAGQKITVSQLRGDIEESNYQIDGWIDGFSTQAPFSLSLRVDPLIVPKEPRYLLALPVAAQKYFDRFSPSGQFRALVLLTRPQAGAPLSYDGRVELLNVSGTYHGFAYPLQEVRGEIRFNDERVELTSLRGKGLTGANVNISGFIQPPRDGAQVQLRITATDTPIDHHMFAALSAPRAAMIRLFTDADAYQRLLDARLLNSSAQKQALQRELEELQAHDPQSTRIEELKTQLKRPTFDLGGNVNAEIRIDRALGDDSDYVVSTRIHLENLGALFRYWPYPLRFTHGTLVIQPGEILLKDVRMAGPTGALGSIQGSAQLLTQAQGGLLPDFQIDALQVPIDELLYASIPHPQDHWLRQLHANARFDAIGKVFRRDDGQIDFSVDCAVKDGQARPFAGNYTLDGLTAQVGIGRERVEVHSLTGKHGQTQLHVQGVARGSGPDQQVLLDLTAKDMLLQDPILDLLPPDSEAQPIIQKLFDQYQPAGRMDAHVHFDKSAATHPYQITLTPREMSFVMRQQRIASRFQQGTIEIAPGLVKLRDIKAQFGEQQLAGQVELEGQVHTGDSPQVNLNFTLACSEICDNAKAVLPQAVTRVLKQLSLNGAYRIEKGQLSYIPDRPQKPGQLKFDGTVQFENARAQVGVPVTEMHGHFKVSIDHQYPQPHPRIALQVNAESLKLAQRKVAPLTLEIASDASNQRLLLNKLQGNAYGGTLSGSGDIELNPDGHYRAFLALHDVNLAPLLYPQHDDPKTAASPATSPSSVSGLLSASLSVEAPTANEKARTGRGKVNITDASLLNFPAAMALFHLSNLSIPQSQSFDRASLNFTIDGDLINIEPIRFEAPSVEMIGVGTLQYSTRQLNVEFVTRNPNALKLGAFSDLMAVFKDQLMTIKVTGPIDRPSAALSPFSGVRETWQRLFSQPSNMTNVPTTSP